MISDRLINKLIEIYQDFGLSGLRQEIKDLKLPMILGCKVSDIVDLVLSNIKES